MEEEIPVEKEAPLALPEPPAEGLPPVVEVQRGDDEEEVPEVDRVRDPPDADLGCEPLTSSTA